MFRSIILTSVIIACVLGWARTQETKKEVLKGKPMKPKTTQTAKVLDLAPHPALKAQSPKVPSFEDLEEKYQDLSEKELTDELNRMNQMANENRLIELANTKALVPEKELQLIMYLRSKVVLSKLLFDREAERMGL